MTSIPKSPSTAQQNQIQQAPFNTLPRDMYEKVAANLPAEGLIALRGSTRTARENVTPLLGKIFTVHKKIDAATFKSDMESLEKADALLKEIAQLPALHRAIPMQTMAGKTTQLIDSISKENGKAKPASIAMALAIVSKLLSDPQASLPTELAKEIGILNQAEVATVTAALDAAHRPAVVEGFVKLMGGLSKDSMSERDRMPMCAAVFDAIKQLPSEFEAHKQGLRQQLEPHRQAVCEQLFMASQQLAARLTGERFF